MKPRRLAATPSSTACSTPRAPPSATERAPRFTSAAAPRWRSPRTTTGCGSRNRASAGFAVRVYRSGRTAFAAGGPEAVAGLLDRARAALPRSRARRGARAAPPVSGRRAGSRGRDGPDVPRTKPSPGSCSPASGASSRAAGEGAVTLSEASIALGERRERIATTAGREAAWTTRGCLARRHGRRPKRRRARSPPASSRSGRVPEELPLHRLARHAADRVLLPLHGRPLEASRFDLLLDSHVAAHVVARLAPLFFGDDADALLAARTRDGRDPLAAPLVTLVDDASAPGGPVRTPRDGEGTPQARHVVVERGVPVSRLTDVAAAARRGTPPTGNAVRRAWSDPPSIGVTNFFVDPAAGVSPLDLLGGAARGFYAAILLSRPGGRRRREPLPAPDRRVPHREGACGGANLGGHRLGTALGPSPAGRGRRGRPQVRDRRRRGRRLPDALRPALEERLTRRGQAPAPGPGTTAVGAGTGAPGAVCGAPERSAAPRARCVARRRAAEARRASPRSLPVPGIRRDVSVCGTRCRSRTPARFRARSRIGRHVGGAGATLPGSRRGRRGRRYVRDDRARRGRTALPVRRRERPRLAARPWSAEGGRRSGPRPRTPPPGAWRTARASSHRSP